MVKLRRVGKEKAVKLKQRKYFKSSGCNLGSNHIWFYTDTDRCVTCTQTTARSLGRKGTDPQLLFEINIIFIFTHHLSPNNTSTQYLNYHNTNQGFPSSLVMKINKHLHI